MQQGTFRFLLRFLFRHEKNVGKEAADQKNIGCLREKPHFHRDMEIGQERGQCGKEQDKENQENQQEERFRFLIEIDQQPVDRSFEQ